MNYHPNAALTRIQRARVQQLHGEGVSQTALARQFGVHRRTIQRWIGRTETRDRAGGPRQHGRRVVTEAYRAAVLAERQAHPRHGPKRIAHDLRERFPTANVATIWRILHAAGVTQRAPKKTDAPVSARRPTSAAAGHPGTAGDSRRTWPGTQNQSDSHAHAHEVLGNPHHRVE